MLQHQGDQLQHAGLTTQTVRCGGRGCQATQLGEGGAAGLGRRTWQLRHRQAAGERADLVRIALRVAQQAHADVGLGGAHRIVGEIEVDDVLHRRRPGRRAHDVAHPGRHDQGGAGLGTHAQAVEDEVCAAAVDEGEDMVEVEPLAVDPAHLLHFGQAHPG